MAEAHRTGFFMAIDKKLSVEIEEALDALRDATVNRDISRADRLKKVLTNFLNPLGYTVIEDKKLIYTIGKFEG